MKKSFLVISGVTTSLLLTAISDAYAAGCVVARGAGMPNSSLGLHHGEDGQSEHDNMAEESNLQLTVAYRAFRSDRHFSGKEEHKNRKQEGSEVINDSRFIDVALSYEFNDLYSMSVTLPFAYHDRSSVVRDANRVILQRYHTQNAGFGDIQVVGNRWVFDPKEATNGNISVGVGLDMPTGKEDARDVFMAYNAESGRIVAETRTVDQSIQLGDGGWGLILNVNSYYRFSSRLAGYFDSTYALTPEEKNGVPTFRSNPFEAEMSIADTYLARSGINYLAYPKYDLVLSLGARIEGVAVKDLIGGDDGFRRPGYDVSIEPGVSMTINSWMLDLYVPITVDQNRQRSVADKQYSASSGIRRHGDAAFADYSVTFAVTKVL